MYTIVGADGKEYGPVSAEKVREWLKSGRANSQTVIRKGTFDWTTIGALTDFISTGVALPVRFAAPTGKPEPFDFKGEWKEYFEIWLGNALLTVLTLGIYAAWAKVRRLQYFYANTSLFGQTFSYLADPVRILIGNAIVVGAFVVFTLLGRTSPLAQLLFLAVAAAAMPVLIVRSFMFTASNLGWSGLNFSFTGRYRDAMKVFLLWPLLVPFTLGLLVPYVARRQKEFIINHHRFGTTPFAFSGEWEPLFRIYLRSFLYFIPLVIAYIGILLTAVTTRVPHATGGLAATPAAHVAAFAALLLVGVPLAIAGSFYFRTHVFNYVWNATSIAGNRFQASMRLGDLVRISLVNWLVTMVTLGLLYPWCALRLYKFRLGCLLVLPSGNVNEFVAAAAEPPVDAVGAAATDYFDFDIGFGG